jgi:hypothetical protein
MDQSPVLSAQSRAGESTKTNQRRTCRTFPARDRRRTLDAGACPRVDIVERLTTGVLSRVGDHFCLLWGRTGIAALCGSRDRAHPGRIGHTTRCRVPAGPQAAMSAASARAKPRRYSAALDAWLQAVKNARLSAFKSSIQLAM